MTDNIYKHLTKLCTVCLGTGVKLGAPGVCDVCGGSGKVLATVNDIPAGPGDFVAPRIEDDKDV